MMWSEVEVAGLYRFEVGSLRQRMQVRATKLRALPDLINGDTILLAIGQ